MKKDKSTSKSSNRKSSREDDIIALAEKTDSPKNKNENQNQSPKSNSSPQNSEIDNKSVIQNSALKANQPENQPATAVLHSKDYAMKIVLLNGLLKRPDYVSFSKSKKLMQSKSFNIKEVNVSREDQIMEMISKIRKNVNIFTIQEIYLVINFEKVGKAIVKKSVSSNR